MLPETLSKASLPFGEVGEHREYEIDYENMEMGYVFPLYLSGILMKTIESVKFLLIGSSCTCLRPQAAGVMCLPAPLKTERAVVQ